MNRMVLNRRMRQGLRLLGMPGLRPRMGPRVISLEVTHACNLRCEFCESHGSLMAAPITSRRTYEGGRTQMSLETVASLARSFARLGVDRVDLSGKGDPITHPKIVDIVRTIKAAGIECWLVTNGTLPKPGMAATLVECGLDRLSVSLNAGSRDVYRLIAKRDLWDRVLAFLREVLELRQATGARRPEVQLTYVINRNNVDDLDNVVNLAAELKVDAMSWMIMSVLPETVGLEIEPAHVDQLRARLPEWGRRLELAGVAHDFPRLAAELPLRTAKQAAPQLNPLQEKLPCYVGWTFTVIGPDGTVAPCCYCEDKPIGNVVEKDFVEVWRGDAYADLRRRSLALPRGGAAICGECFTNCNRAMENQRIHETVKAIRPGLAGRFLPGVENGEPALQGLRRVVRALVPRNAFRTRM